MATASRVIVYTQPGCSACRAEKAWLSRLAVSFEERDIRAEDRWLAELRALGAEATPVTVVEAGPRRQVVTGFDQHRLLHALDLPHH